MSISKNNLHCIRLRGVRQNNLKGFDLDLPLGQLIVVTGLSGAGKSSLVFETLHAEGQRRYVETFSPYARQFMDMLDRPQVDSIENIRPSIAIEQRNTVRTSRSTVGTMTELCDYFKVWFSHTAQLIDPATGSPIDDDNPATIWKKARSAFPDRKVMIAFSVKRQGKLSWETIIESLRSQGYGRVVIKGYLTALDEIPIEGLKREDALAVIQDRIQLKGPSRTRFIEAVTTALHYGQGQVELLAETGESLAIFSEGLHSPQSGIRYRPAVPNLFSFNSPLGACPKCRGFGRVITLDERLVIPDATLTLAGGAIRAFQGAVYSESQRDLLQACAKFGVPIHQPWREMSPEHQDFVMGGEPGYEVDGREWPNGWYGVRRFFSWLEGNTYKMHVRVFLSKYRAYVKCPDCDGARLVPEALLWRWHGHALPDLYQLPVSELLPLIESKATRSVGNKRTDVALENILTRLRYLMAVGLGYLTLDRASRSLSGGETQRVSLTSSLGTSLVDTLFVLDEPSIGLHVRDIDRLIGILRQLTDQGNTVVVVEHDEAIMRAADLLLEIGPQPGAGGGHIVAMGTPLELQNNPASLTGGYLADRNTVPLPGQRRPVKRSSRTQAWLRINRATKHNLRNFSAKIPLGRFVALSGVSGSGKSTLLDNVIHQGLLSRSGKATDDPAELSSITTDQELGDIVLVDQTPASRTPRSNPALFVEAWHQIRQLFALTDEARSAGFTTSHFSFNSGQGRCPTCEGLGYEKVEMQFMADVYVPCPSCEGKRFTTDVLAIQWHGKNPADILAMTIDEAIPFFAKQPRILHRLEPLAAVGLGYLTLGQPLNTLSGGESQRLKLVRFLSRFDQTVENALILLDEPTTGLHRDDVKRLLNVLHKLVDLGHSLVVIEHQPDVLVAADWILELGPEAGADGGKLVFAGTPEELAHADTESASYVKRALEAAVADADTPALMAAEAPSLYGRDRLSKLEPPTVLSVLGAREHNLKNLSVDIPHRAITVVTGVSGSGKSTLAFDIVFAESQRRFMESMSAWARQYVEQLPRPDIDALTGIPPAVAIEQRVTRGTRKSTVATITEVAQYLRLLYARVGVPYSPHTGDPLVALSPAAITDRVEQRIAQDPPTARSPRLLLAPLIRGRKGHHQPLADWAVAQGYTWLRVDGQFIELSRFEKLDRYREHDIEVAVAHIEKQGKTKNFAITVAGEPADLPTAVERALHVGKGGCLLASIQDGILGRFSTKRTDPVTGEAFPEIDPKHFSWNASRGWCPTCRGHGQLHGWMAEDERFEDLPATLSDGAPCPACHGTRLNDIARRVYLDFKDGERLNFPDLLALTSSGLLNRLRSLKLDAKGRAVVKDIFPEVEERLNFMDELGLDYLTLDRATNTLSGGEAQRIRLAAQLGSNLSGVLYVLDEPSIGLHARDNSRLIDSLKALRQKGNTLLIVEHDLDTMRAADCIIDLGPAAGCHGGELLARGTFKEISANPESVTGRYLHTAMQHPLRGSRRDLPAPYHPRRKTAGDDWCVLESPSLRNLKGDTLNLPKSRLTVVCGISGAGKSTLVRDLLKPAVQEAIRTKTSRLAGNKAPGFSFKRLLHGDTFRQAIEVDQDPIGKTPRSTPSTYTGALDIIRQYFGNLPEARMRGFTAGTFSFNTKGGRCETCKGAGRVKLEMNFIADTYIPCDDCGGRRYGPELLDIQWNGKSIADVLEMTFEDAARFFTFHQRLKGMLELMVDTGLGYLTLGQTSPTLSGGEAQRLKLVTELAKGLPTLGERKQGVVLPNLYILEEPTIGLHQSDTERLIELLHRLVDQGHTVVVIEHNLDVIAEADYLVELGPDGGEAGGEILYQGPVEGLLDNKASPTAPFLRETLGLNAKRKGRSVVSAPPLQT